MVTRCPLQLIMKAGPKAARIQFEPDNGPPVAIPLQESQIEQAIQDAMDAVCGRSDNICMDKDIRLTVQRPNAPDITLMDLPGIVHGGALVGML